MHYSLGAKINRTPEQYNSSSFQSPRIQIVCCKSALVPLILQSELAQDKTKNKLNNRTPFFPLIFFKSCYKSIPEYITQVFDDL